MKLRDRVAIYLSLTFLVLAGSLYLVFDQLIMSDFLRLENENALRNAERVKEAVTVLKEEIALKAEEWGAWDDTYSYFDSKDDEYEQSNLTFEALSQLRLRHFIMFDLKGNIVRALKVGEEEVAELNEREAKELFLVAKQAAESPSHGLIRTDGRNLLAGAAPVTDSAGTAEVKGTILFTRDFSEETVQKINELTKVPVVFDNIETQFPSHSIIKLFSDSLLVQDVLRGVDKKPILKFEIKLPRDIYQRGLNARDTATLYVLFFTVITLVIAIMFVKSSVLDPLTRIGTETEKIGAEKYKDLNVTEAGSPEFKRLGKEINNMLRQIRAARLEAQAANDAKSKFIARVSHELRTPIAGIIGLNSMLTKRNNQKELIELLNLQGSNAEGLLTLINEILDFSAVEKGELTFETIEFNPRKIAKEALETVAGRLKEGVSIKLSVSPNVPAKVKGDPTRLKQVLVNLLGNSIKFTSKGEVGLEVKDNLNIKVWDTGIGIPKNKIQSIFEPFKQADESITRVYQGTGLGLSIVKQTVEAQGGKIWVESQEGKGSSFFVHIPFVGIQEFSSKIPSVRLLGENSVAKVLREYSVDISLNGELEIVTEEDTISEINPKMIAVVSPTNLDLRDRLYKAGLDKIISSPFLIDDLQDLIYGAKKSSSYELSKGRSLRILVADDTRTNRIILEDLLREAGHDVVCVEDGAQAVKTLEEDRSFDLLLTDISMPIMDGYTVARKLRESGSKIPVVAITAHVLEEEQAKMKDAGMNDILFKPIRPENIDKVLKRVMV